MTDYQKECIKAGYDCLKCTATSCIGHQISFMTPVEFNKWQNDLKSETKKDKQVWAGIITEVN